MSVGKRQPWVGCRPATPLCRRHTVRPGNPQQSGTRGARIGGRPVHGGHRSTVVARPGGRGGNVAGNVALRRVKGCAGMPRLLSCAIASLLCCVCSVVLHARGWVRGCDAPRAERSACLPSGPVPGWWHRRGWTVCGWRGKQVPEGCSVCGVGTEKDWFSTGESWCPPHPEQNKTLVFFRRVGAGNEGVNGNDK